MGSGAVGFGLDGRFGRGRRAEEQVRHNARSKEKRRKRKTNLRRLAVDHDALHPQRKGGQRLDVVREDEDLVPSRLVVPDEELGCEVFVWVHRVQPLLQLCGPRPEAGVIDR